MTDKRFSREVAIKIFEEKGTILPGYGDVIAEYTSQDDDENHESLDNERRVKYVEVSKVALERIFIEGSRFIVKDGLPEDAEIVGIQYIADKNVYRMTFESEEFRPIAEGANVPEFRSIEVESQYDE